MMKFMNKKLSKKGFTLAELLVVVAIIAVLVAVAIPVFTSQLERSREATDLANIRAAYAEVMTHAIGEDTAEADLKSSVTSDGKITYDDTNGTYTAIVKANQKDASKWETSNNGVKVATMTTGSTYAESTTIAPATGTYTITYVVSTKKFNVVSAT